MIFNYLLISYLLGANNSQFSISNNIENLIKKKYETKEYIELSQGDETLIITMKISANSTRMNFGSINRYCLYGLGTPTILHKFNQEKILFKETVDNLEKKIFNMKYKNINLVFNIILDDTFNSDLIKLYDCIVDKFKIKNNVKFLRNFTKLNLVIKNNLQKFVNAVFFEEDIYFQILFKKNEKFICLWFGLSEIGYKEYIIDSLIQSDYFKLLSKKLVENLFYNINLNTFAYYCSTSNIHIFLKTGEFNLKTDKNNLIFDDLDEIRKLLVNFDVSDHFLSDLRNSFNLLNDLSTEDIISVILLYNSLPQELKIVGINQILNSMSHIQSIIIYYVLEKVSIISKEQRNLLWKINLNFSTLYKNYVGRIFLINHVDRFNIKSAILNFKPNLTDRYKIYFVFFFCNILDDVYINNIYDDRYYRWKENYDEIFEELNLDRKKRNFLYLFKNLITDQKKFIKLIGFKENTIFNLLTDLMGVESFITTYKFLAYYQTKNEKGLMKLINT